MHRNAEEGVKARAGQVPLYRNRVFTRISHKLSTALRYVGAGGDFPGFGTLQGVDPASPPNLHETPASTRPPFARHEFCEICGLSGKRHNKSYEYFVPLVAIFSWMK